jgi:thiol:disulfide interchange protein DsbA
VLATPQSTRDPSRIELVEVFWYGCPHCYEFNNKYLHEFEKGLAKDVDFHLIPATFPGWTVHAQAFFAAQELGVLERLHQPLFDRIIVNPRAFKDPSDFKPIFVENGVSAEDFDKVFKASGMRKISRVEELVKLADQQVKSYRVSGVPALIVNGKYRIGVREAGGMANMLRIANYLIDRERQASASGK